MTTSTEKTRLPTTTTLATKRRRQVGAALADEPWPSRQQQGGVDPRVPRPTATARQIRTAKGQRHPIGRSGEASDALVGWARRPTSPWTSTFLPPSVHELQKARRHPRIRVGHRKRTVGRSNSRPLALQHCGRTSRRWRYFLARRSRGSGCTPSNLLMSSKKTETAEIKGET